MEILNYSPNITKFSNSSRILDFPNPDLLKCGSCCTEFLLSDIVVFIQHKKKPCNIELTENERNPFKCSSCTQTFKNAHSLLEHAQFFHKINIFINNHDHETVDKHQVSQRVSSEQQIFIDVNPSESSSYLIDRNHYSNKTSSVSSISSTSPTTSTSSKLSTSFSLNQDSRFVDMQTPPKAESSIANMKTDCSPNINNLKFDFAGSSIKAQNENTCSNDSNCNKYQSDATNQNRDSYFMSQTSASPKLLNADRNFEDVNANKTSRPGSSSDEKKKKSKQTASFYCDICNAAFNQKIHLTKHSAKHTGIKPFKCTECNYSTVERSHLKVHVRVHTGEKPFKCTYCDYATAQSSTLKIHKKRHHDKIEETFKFRENKSDDSQSYLETTENNSSELIKSESKEITHLLNKNNYEDYAYFNNRHNFSIDRRSNTPVKRTKTNYLSEKSKKLTSYMETMSNNTHIDVNNLATSDFNSVESISKLRKNSITSQQQFLGPNEPLSETDNKLLGLANIALEREIN